jgi:gas vesicle protein
LKYGKCYSHERYRTTRFGGLITGLLIGGLAGFGALMLLAPQSGKKTRTQIRQKSTELQDRATVTFDDLVALSHYDNRKILAGTREKN